jgi:thymidine kinase
MDRLTDEGSDEHLSVRHRGAPGWIEVIIGPMFSGKSEELIRRLRRARIARLKVQVFKPEIDVRYSKDHIVSHSAMRLESVAVSTATEVLARVEAGTDVVGIDEGQFFDAQLVEAVNTLAGRGLRVIIAGLDQDYTGQPFEPMPQLLAIAKYITKTHAICVRCGQPAHYSQRIVEVEGRVVVGAADAYEARCRRCFVPHTDAPTRYVTEEAYAEADTPDSHKVF